MSITTAVIAGHHCYRCRKDSCSYSQTKLIPAAHRVFELLCATMVRAEATTSARAKANARAAFAAALQLQVTYH